MTIPCYGNTEIRGISKGKFCQIEVVFDGNEL